MEPFIGTLMLFAGTFPPVGWYACEGQILQIADNEVLFMLIGTTYGGDGMTTFALPDLRSRVPNHRGMAPGMAGYTLGQVSGRDAITLTSANNPIHSHPIQAVVNASCNNSESEDSDTPVGCYPGKMSANYYAATADAQMGTGNFTASLLPAGGNNPIPMAMPSLAMMYCIAYEGLFPPQP